MNQTPDFADRLAATQDQILHSSEDELTTARRRFLADAAVPSRSANRVVWLAVPVSGLAMAAAAAAIFAMSSVEPTLTATSNGGDVAVGDWISSPAGEVGIDFSDGTVITLATGSQARIVSMDTNGAHLLLERGHADLDVVHTGSADWSIAAGPFDVLVTGTHFGAEWSPEDQTLVIAMKEGSVVVSGPLLEGGQVVSDVGTLTVSLLDNHTQLTNDPLPKLAVVVEEIVPEIATDAPLRVERRVPVIVPPEPVDVLVVTWKDLAGKGKYSDALTLAREVGVDGILQRSDSMDLYLFGDMARLAKDYALARTSFESLRNRFPGTSYAAEASFMLGKMAYDQDQDFRGAVRWFGTHLEERPNGASAEDAMSLLMLSYDKAGDRTATRTAAKDYLDRFPKGKSATQAKSFTKRR